MEKKISIIIPVYNAERYIETCINSILKQEYTNIEVIIINNGSNDNTLKKLNILCQKDNRINLINTEQKGVSYARNIGIKYATGDFITFVDADDFVEKQMYSIMLKKIIENNADICFSAYYMVTNNIKKEELFPWPEKEKSYFGKEVSKKLLPQFIGKISKNEKKLLGSVWRILIKSSIAKKIYFDENIQIAEDLLYIVEVLENINKAIMINIPLYNYVENFNSALMSYKNNYEENNNELHRKLILNFEQNNFFSNIENQYRYASNRISMYMYMLSNINKNSTIKLKDKLRIIRHYNKKFGSDKFIIKGTFKYLNFNQKITYILLKKKLSYITLLTFQINQIKHELNIKKVKK